MSRLPDMNELYRGDGGYGMRVPEEANGYQTAHARWLLDSYRQLTGRDLLAPELPALAVAREMYYAPFAVLSHDDAEDPCFTYANLTAQILFSMPWRDIVGLPSRHSAEPRLREERQRLLEMVSRQGYIDDYRGVRIGRDGRRFEIRQATVWNLPDSQGQVVGQAAMFADWVPLWPGELGI